MKLLTNLSAELAEGAFDEPRGILQQVVRETAPGYFHSVKLGEAGLIISRGNDQAAIPLDELISVAEKLVPELRVPSGHSDA